MVRNLKNKSGFTLVELLVVVAIIGVLATAGIPQYRRMVMKSKKAEAKTYLGEIANAQAAFFAEFGAYGTNLRVMGMEGGDTAAPNAATALINNNQRIYKAGFLTAGCADAAGAAIPPAATPQGDAIRASNPGYNTYIAGAAAGVPGTNYSSMFGRVTKSALCARVAANASVIPAAANNFATYRAIASGVVRTGVNLDTGAGAPAGQNASDVWQMDESRTLTNSEDGMF